MRRTVLFVCINIVLQHGADAFAGLRNVCTAQTASSISMSAVSRRSFAAASANALVSAAAVLAKPAAGVAAPQIPFEDAIANLMLAKDVLIPSHKYFEMSQFDAARTNVNYITRQLGIRKSIGAAVIEGAELCDDAELVEEASELAAVADSTFTNYDSSIYTVQARYNNMQCSLTIATIDVTAQDSTVSGLLLCISDDMPMLFRPNCDIYYKQCVHMLDVFIALASPEVQARARLVADAKRATLPKFLFKEFKEQGRPATP
eukprot:16164-Heterococcus_DN1.PRE.2